MKKIDEVKLRKYQTMHTARDFINSIEESNVVDDRSLNLIKIKDAIQFLKNLKDKSEFEIVASNEATNMALNYLDEMEVYIKDCIIKANQERDELSQQLHDAREASSRAFETTIKPNIQEIIKALQKVQEMPLPRTHKRDAFTPISDEMQKEIKNITDLIGTTFSR